MKRKDALRKVRTICERLDNTNPNAFPIVAKAMFLFGSTLTTKPDPEDIDLVLVYEENPKIECTDAELHRMMFYEPRLQPQNRASVELRRGMKRVQLYMVPHSIENWEYLLFFPNGGGLRLIWKPALSWGSLVSDIEANPSTWSGPRSQEFEQSTLQRWEAMTAQERRRQQDLILAALDLQEAMLT
jgi:hypothetical protein